MQTTCGGCSRVPRSSSKFIPCAFARTGYMGTHALVAPCYTGYHPRCFRAGTPFTSRRKNGQGLVFPNVGYWPNFVCERCTVIAQLQRPLGHPGDRWLLQLERVRILDMAHSWSETTTVGYQSQLRKLAFFESQHPGLRVLPRTTLTVPPTGLSVSLAWAELDASVTPLRARGVLPDRLPVYNTVRRIRSAVSNVAIWHTVQTHPNSNYFDQGTHRMGPVSGPSTGGFTIFSKGLSARIGSNPRQATALLGRHITALEAWMDKRYLHALTSADRSQWALAGLAHLVLWLGWLRGGEAFGLSQSDISYVPPSQASRHDLPKGVGLVLLRMVEDKTHRTTAQTLVLAYRCVTGLHLGKWLMRVVQLGLWDPASDSPLFRTPGGTPWTSHFYRTTYLYPGLLRLRAQGDPFLSPFDGSDPSLTIPFQFWSLHSYRRGARTHCQRSHPGTAHRKATKTQVYEHARWRSPGGRAIDDVYRAWTLYDKVKITLLCH